MPGPCIGRVRNIEYNGQNYINVTVSQKFQLCWFLTIIMGVFVLTFEIDMEYRMQQSA